MMYILYSIVTLTFSFLLLRSYTTQESIILMKNVGIQLEKKNGIGITSKRFIDITRIKDIIIYEFVDPCKCRNILALLLHDYHQTIPMFDAIVDKKNL